MTVKIKLPKIVAFLAIGRPEENSRQITHAELDDGRTIPVEQISPEMWRRAGMRPQGMPAKGH